MLQKNNSKKKIIIIGPAHPLRGGLATFNHRMCKAFNDAGHNCSIVSFSLQYPAFMFPGTTQYTNDNAPENITIATKINSVNPINWLITGRYLKKLQADVIIVRYWLPLMGPALGTILRRIKKSNRPTIICIADNIKPHESRPGDNAFTTYFVKPIDVFITMSEKVSHDLVAFNKMQKPVLQLQHPLYDNFGAIIETHKAKEALGIPSHNKVMMFFGFIRKYKGLDLLLEAMQSPNIKAQNITLIIAGEFYENQQPYLDLIEKTSNKENIKLYNYFIDDKDVAKYICATDVIVQPYKNATQSGVTPLAYYFEKPMIVTNVGGLPNMAPHKKSGLVCEPNAMAIEQAILQFFNEDVLQYQPYIKAQKKLLSWEKFVADILGFV
jgi:glycosyltransferase involved in cell wall biosynthesis